MKHFKKIMALVIAMVMIMGTMSTMAFAESGERTLDDGVEITGLEQGDTVKLYQVLSWDSATSQGWQLVAPFTGVSGLLTTDLTTNPQQTITIDDGIVNDLTACITSSTVAKDTATIGADKKYTEDINNVDLAAGLYIAIVTPAKEGVIYNPVILGVDWETGNPAVNAATSEIPTSTVGGKAVAKKSVLTVDKTSTGSATNDGSDAVTSDTNAQGKDSATVKVGDTLSFKVESQIPAFSKAYTDPTYKITDKLSAGLTLDFSSVTVTKPADAVKDRDYTIANNGDGYTVEFINKDYLWGLGAATDIEITYSAKVNTDATESVNHENNTVTLEYSNNPNDSSSTGKIKDGTNHYTFDIDGNLLGQNEYDATEVVKVGVDKDGNEITETVKLANGKSVGALEGAKFKLCYDEAGANPVPKYKVEGGVATQDGNWEDIESDGQGRISITGLDAGVYYLIETQAPEGYIKMQDAVKVEIKTWFKTVTMTEDGVDFDVQVLDKYTIEIGGVETASYTITNSADTTKTTSSIGDTVVGTDANSGKLKNTQGVELPSTGGIGTTLFYVIGSILVIGAGIVLVTRRRMSAN